MLEPENYWAPRTCLKLPIPEYETAAEMLSEAADAILTEDFDLAGELVRRADMDVLFKHSHTIQWKLDPHILRKRLMKEPVAKLAKVSSRMPCTELIQSIFARDGWRCRFCGCRVVLAESRKIMSKALPGAIPWNMKKIDYSHGAFFAMSASLDHVVPHSAGGTNEEDNLVTACHPCQFGRGAFLLEEVGLIDPRTRPPVRDGWDGLGRLLRKVRAPVANQESVGPASPKRAGLSMAEWCASLDAMYPASSGRLIQLLDGCADLNVSRQVGEVLLIVRLKIGEVGLGILGVRSNGLVEIPWHIAGQKDAFKCFAEAIADAIPEASVYETPKHWVVSKADKQLLNILDFLEAADTLRPALKLLRSALLADRKG